MLVVSLRPAQPVRGNYHIIEDNNEKALQLDLVNMMTLPVQINELRWDDQSIPFDQAQCIGTNCDIKLVSGVDSFILNSAAEGQDFIPVSFTLLADVSALAQDPEMSLTLNVSLYGSSRDIDIPILTNYVPAGITQGVKPIATLDEALASHDFLIQLSDNHLAVQRGDWDVVGDLILPEGYKLTIPSETSLRFAEGKILLASGSVDMLGTEDAPITVASQNGAWGGMVILNAEDASDWENVIIGEMSGISYSGWGLTGGITFYRSEINIISSVIGNNATEDALNVIQSPFTLTYVEFLNTPSDAFDGDFTEGTVQYCSFHDVLGDGFDVSGSTVMILDSYFVNIADKAISAGEHSTVTVENVTIRDVAIGIASKDLSRVEVFSSVIDGARVAGLAAYIKKPQYGAASIGAIGIEFLNTETEAICQTESDILLNEEVVSPQEVDVDALYDQGILGN